MTLSKLLNIYPDASLSKIKIHDPLVRSYPYKEGWINFFKKDKNEKEWDLIEILLDQDAPLKKETKSDWFSYLAGETTMVPTSSKGALRFLFFFLDKKDSTFEKKEWLRAIHEIFTPNIEGFFIQQNQYILIQSYSSNFISETEMSGFLQTLDDDFSIQTRMHIGQYWEKTTNLKELYEEEYQMSQIGPATHSNRVTTLADIALYYYTHDKLKDSPVGQKINQVLTEEYEWVEIILALWNSQGNISVAAKALYLHRNTLQYRLDKFNEKTHLSLKNMNDLFLCYLFIQ
ncbi:PucR family transcriptional regulator [Lacticigenium naphthae]|uniref:PucR family transcriptional regulator n=1 Tax=Lacticigenium naphthae TaxID=515351 RepID=UPI0003F85242|nr:helix-turn-helix domain-containing protein [Lacticigenium naphthae]